MKDYFEYAGIGTRDLHRDISKRLFLYAFLTGLSGSRVRSGGADGCDTSFEIGLKYAYDFLIKNVEGMKGKLTELRLLNVFIPWHGFNGRLSNRKMGYFDNFRNYPRTIELAKANRPINSPYESLSPLAQKLMARNSQQVFGEDGFHQVAKIVCHTNNGGASGGTGQAIRIAEKYGIPVYNYGNQMGFDYIESEIKRLNEIYSEKYKQILDNLDFDNFEDYILDLYENYTGIEYTEDKSLTDMKLDILVHGCNCFNTMGSGVAKFIREKYPEAYEADCKTKSGDKLKLGKFTYLKVKDDNGRDLIIINAYTQYKYGTDVKQVDYDAVKKVFKEINSKFPNKTIAFPRIGAGLAGGCWLTISNIINVELKNARKVLSVFNPQKVTLKRNKAKSLTFLK